MKYITGIIFFLSAQFIVVFAQSNYALDKLQTHYEMFEYSSVIHEAEKILMDKERLTDSLLINIYTLKAASHFAMGDQISTRKAFVEILKIDAQYILNDLSYSPKLITFYNEVENEFSDIIKLNEKKFENKEYNKNLNSVDNENQKDQLFNNALAKSLLVPGLGHIDRGDITKGWILTSASVVTLSSMVYFIVDANSKEKDYLGETNSDLINSRYTTYNNSYKIRNILITSYVAIWLYSQIDLLFFSNNLGSKYISEGINNHLHPLANDKFLLSIKISF